MQIAVLHAFGHPFVAASWRVVAGSSRFAAVDAAAA
jgi:hypothetical protein